MDTIDFIDLPVHEPEAVARAVQEYIEKRKSVLDSLDVVVRISICKSSHGLRMKSEERKDQLKQLILLNPELPTVYKDTRYEFDFVALTFREARHNKPVRLLHFTPSEIVMLYIRLIKRQDVPQWHAFFSHIKKRFGDDFLFGVTTL